MLNGARTTRVNAAGTRYECCRVGIIVGWRTAHAAAIRTREARGPDTSAPLFAELTNILERRKFAKKIAASTLTVDELVDRYAALVQVVRPALTARIAPDPDDDVVIGTALAATADLIVTGDQALLSVAAYRSIRIVSVSEARQAIG